MGILKTCTIEGCEKRQAGRGWCAMHYQRWRRGGDPLVCGTANGEVAAWLEANAGHEGDECLPWPFSKNGNGYGVAQHEGRQTSAQFVMCTLAHGERPTDRHEAAHSCGKGHEGCINPRHLRWATRKENMADAVLHGTAPRGERQGSARLTADDVQAIRANNDNEHQRVLAARYGVAQGHINRIINRKAWSWLD